MTTGLLIFLGLVTAAVWYWLDSARAREIATALGSQLCRRHGLQFLDGTAALDSLGVRWTPGGVRLRRVFRFDYSEAGVGRHTGHVVLVGIDLEEVSLGLPGGTAVGPSGDHRDERPSGPP